MMNQLSRGLLKVFVLVSCIGLCPAYSSRSQADSPSDDPQGVLDGVVVEVQENLLKLEGGITVDISHAGISTFSTGFLNVSSIKPGTTVRVIINGPSDGSSPFVAEFVRLRVPGEILITGRIQEAEVETDDQGQIIGGTIRILNRSFTLTRLQTVGIRKKQLKIGRLVTVGGISNGEALVINQIYPGLGLPAILP